LHGFHLQPTYSSRNSVTLGPFHVAIVDDDPAVLEALGLIFHLEGCKVSTFTDGAEFLAFTPQVDPDCLLLDVNMPTCSGREVLQAVTERAYSPPVIMMSGQGDIPTAVAAIKAGACDFIAKPFEGDVVAKVRDAVHATRNAVSTTGSSRSCQTLVDAKGLTQRERDVLTQIIKGRSNKEAARELRISYRTVEVHRARIMDKVGARNTADLMRIVFG